MPVAERWAYFDHAAVAPLSRPAHDAIARWSREALEQGHTLGGAWTERLKGVRTSAARILGAAEDEIALVPNTTAGINLVAEGYPWQAGDNVVTLAGEFPSNLYPWMNLAARGVEERRVDPGGAGIDLDRIADACDERTRIVAASWVGYATGWRADVDALAEAAHARGALLFLDAIQGLGVFPLDVRRTPVDFLAADGHKWLLGPEGAGLLYVRREHLDRLRPLNLGWNSVVRHGDTYPMELALLPTAARFEGGSLNMAGFLGLGASLDLLAGFGLTPTASPIADRVLATTAQAIRRLEEAGAVVAGPRSDRERSGIVAVDLPGRDLAAMRRQCLEAGVALSLREGRLRISPHAYNDERDLDRLVAALTRRR
jgi:selenocysteine lyase/cysteine desulfurase